MRQIAKEIREADREYEKHMQEADNRISRVK
jgi:hypothetical protein